MFEGSRAKTIDCELALNDAVTPMCMPLKWLMKAFTVVSVVFVLYVNACATPSTVTVSVPAMPPAAGGSPRAPLPLSAADVSTVLFAEFIGTTKVPAAVDARAAGNCAGSVIATVMSDAEIAVPGTAGENKIG